MCFEDKSRRASWQKHSGKKTFGYFRIKEKQKKEESCNFLPANWIWSHTFSSLTLSLVDAVTQQTLWFQVRGRCGLFINRSGKSGRKKTHTHTSTHTPQARCILKGQFTQKLKWHPFISQPRQQTSAWRRFLSQITIPEFYRGEKKISGNTVAAYCRLVLKRWGANSNIDTLFSAAIQTNQVTILEFQRSK